MRTRPSKRNIFQTSPGLSGARSLLRVSSAVGGCLCVVRKTLRVDNWRGRFLPGPGSGGKWEPKAYRNRKLQITGEGWFANPEGACTRIKTQCGGGCPEAASAYLRADMRAS